ncbi:unnamed protein product [Prorocentrum cordatum]|uniref:Uncharacterized protein n=1 Tax=Prorocentrum cordatum TaxID=2364126 RepID=A0ABN9W650_9DINO|nr:unnamed protein product [Polarella glacialis]
MGSAAGTVASKQATKYKESSKQAFPKKYHDEELLGSNGTYEVDEATAGSWNAELVAEDVHAAPKEVQTNTRADRYRSSKESAGTVRSSSKINRSPREQQAGAFSREVSTNDRVASKRQAGSFSREVSANDREASKKQVGASSREPSTNGREPSKSADTSSKDSRGTGSKKLMSGLDMNVKAQQVTVLGRDTTRTLSHAALSREGILRERRASSDDPMGGLAAGMKVVGTSKVGQEMGAGTVIGAGNSPGMVMVRMEVGGREMALSAARLQVVEEGSHLAGQLRMQHSRRRHSVA